ncbi:MAG: M20 family metallopeptidase [Acidobacteriia bacterium]|nr:M20 family metallopeptidase [Terriglobia bacterium]
MVKVTRRFVECESPTDDAAAVNRFADLVSDSFGNLASFRKAAGGAYGSHLFGELSLPGRRKQRRVLVLGHLDTVWPLGTLRAMPFRNESGRLWGPGVLDMKGGIVLLLFAARALRELGTPVGSRVWLQLNADEEVGSPSSRPLTEKNAAGAKAVLVLEPGTGLKGKLKTARKGVGNFEVKVQGKAAHAGLDFEAGASAIRELARQITRISTFSDLRRGITVNAGVISGGTRPNVVAAEARAEVDIRVKRVEDARALEKKFRTLEPYDARCSLEIRGGLNRPPMERSSGAADLFRLAKGLAQELGVELEESLSGGGSDGNFTAALGVPTLDGLGAVGEGAHALHESILIDRMADRAALLAKLLAAA